MASTLPAGLDPRTPVLVGAGQRLRRPSHAGDLTDPVELAGDALHAAAVDTGGRANLLPGVQSLACVRPWTWGRSGDPAAAIAAAVSATPAETVLSSMGGDAPQLLLSDACSAIRNGQLDVAAIVGAETAVSEAMGNLAGVGAPRVDLSGSATRIVGTDRPGIDDDEIARGFGVPTEVYALLDVLLRTRHETAPADWLRQTARLWAGLSEVAAGNPCAWLAQRHTADEIASVRPDNRMVTSPYRKLMTANVRVEQAAALLVCSAERAVALGVPPERWVFPQLSLHGQDTWSVLRRRDPSRSPLLEAAGRRLRHCLEDAAAADALAVDLYSCFPSALRIAAESFGFVDPAGTPRLPLTVTGGLTFAGGPGNNYASHSLAAMVTRLRERPGVGLVTGVGYYLTKHAVTLLGTTPPREPFTAVPVATDEAEHPVDHDYAGPVTVEAATVSYDRDGQPGHARAIVRTLSGARAVGVVHDAAGLPELAEDGGVGRGGHLAADGALTVS